MAKLTIKDIELHGKRVFVRVDYNVPMEEKDGSMVINDDTRIRATLPTLDFLVEKGAKILIDDGKISMEVEKFLSRNTLPI